MLKFDLNSSLDPEGKNILTMTDSTATAEAKQNASAEINNIDGFLQNMPDIVCLSHLRCDFVYQLP